jgi:hypothetical protein
MFINHSQKPWPMAYIKGDDLAVYLSKKGALIFILKFADKNNDSLSNHHINHS